jgi:hypothetical protein
MLTVTYLIRYRRGSEAKIASDSAAVVCPSRCMSRHIIVHVEMHGIQKVESDARCNLFIGHPCHPSFAVSKPWVLQRQGREQAALKASQSRQVHL